MIGFRVLIKGIPPFFGGLVTAQEGLEPKNGQKGTTGLPSKTASCFRTEVCQPRVRKERGFIGSLRDGKFMGGR